MRTRSPRTKRPCASTTSSPGSTPSRTATAATLASPLTSLLGHSAARSSHGARNSRTIVRLRGGSTSRRFAKPTPETLHRSWPSRDASARIEIPTGSDRVGCVNSVLPANRMFCDVRPNLRTPVGCQNSVRVTKDQDLQAERRFETPQGAKLAHLAECPGEALAPARVPRLPVQLALRLRVGGAANLRHHHDSVLAGSESPQPGGYAPRTLRAEHLGKVRQPLGDRRRMVVDDVVDAGGAVLDGGERRGGDVVDVDERPDPGARADDRKATVANCLHVNSAFAHRSAGSVERAVAQDESLDRGGAAHRCFEMTDGRERPAKPRRRVRIERIVLRLDRPALTRVRPAGE